MIKEIPAGRVLLIDFDGTLAPYAWPDPPGRPYPGVREALTRLHDARFYIVIFTARAWHGWAPNYRRAQLAEVAAWLYTWQIPFDEISNEKRPSLFLLDDRAIGTPTDQFKYGDWWMQLATKIIDSKEEMYGNQARPDRPT